MRILYIAEIIGKAGIQCVKDLLPQIRREKAIDIVIANADGATNGTGVGKNHAGYIHKLGAAVLTGGDMIYYKKDLVDDFASMTYVLRPANFPAESPGRYYRICTLANGQKLAVVSLLGYSGFSRVHADNPFLLLPDLLRRVTRDTPCVFIDYHAATTADKRTFAHFCAEHGGVSALIGSHGRVQTADARILGGTTATITDAGRTGCINTPGGCGSEPIIGEYLTGIPNWTHGAEPTAENRPELQGVIVDIEKNGKASAIESLRVPLFRT